MAQDTPERLIKAGGFIYIDIRRSEFSGFSLHAELERAFRRKPFLSSGPRLDYVKIPDFGITGENVYVGYNFKVYPFHFKHRVPLRGVFLGLEPLWLLNKHNISRQGTNIGRYGPGVGSLIGYQHLFKNKISVGFEGCMAYVQNLNDNSNRFQGYHHKSGRYIYFHSSFKIGWKF